MPEYVDINIPSTICDPDKLAVDNNQKLVMSDFGIDDDDAAFLKAIDEEFHIMNSGNCFNHYNIGSSNSKSNSNSNTNGNDEDILSMNGCKPSKVTQILQESNIDILKQNMQALMEENKKLRDS